MGGGIRRRSRLMRLYWAEHLEHSKDVQVRWHQAIDAARSLLILGAGRLLDVVLPDGPGQWRVTLVDADRSCLAQWSTLSTPQLAVTPLCLDLTGVLLRWQQQLTKTLPESWEDALQQIRRIPQAGGRALPPSTFLAAGTHDAVLSVNLLSQIPLTWQDTAERYLHRYFPRPFIEAHEAEWLSAAAVGGRMLVEQHLRDLQASKTANLLLITDLEYAHYRVPFHYRPTGYRTAPLQWDATVDTAGSGGWREADGTSELTCEVIESLCGVGADVRTLSSYFPDYQLRETKEWLWHIQPQGIERRDQGTLHRVAAMSFQLIAAQVEPFPTPRQHAYDKNFSKRSVG
ncbi:MAG: hypothetical protein KDD69_09865 [Bdellovibrionales bacterium]|nr:hypothetical protein [Bdellovibrionales bacterium]